MVILLITEGKGQYLKPVYSQRSMFYTTNNKKMLILNINIIRKSV